MSDHRIETAKGHVVRDSGGEIVSFHDHKADADAVVKWHDTYGGLPDLAVEGAPSYIAACLLEGEEGPCGWRSNATLDQADAATSFKHHFAEVHGEEE